MDWDGITTLKFEPGNSTNFSKWVLVHDRVSGGEMPPKKKARPELDLWMASKNH